MNAIVSFLDRSGLFKKDLDYHFARASMVIIFLFFGYQKWFQYEAQGLIREGGLNDPIGPSSSHSLCPA